MSPHTVDQNMIEIPNTIRKAFFLAAVVKAGVAGAGLGLALLGAADVAFAASASQWLDSMKPQALINFFAIGGGVVGISVKIVSAIWN